MVLRLLAFAFFVAALATLCGDAWASFASGLPFQVRSLDAWWTAASPSTHDMVTHSWPSVSAILPYPAPAVLFALGLISLLPTVFFRQRH